MVQVDIFWSYGIGSSFALAAFRQLRRLTAESGKPRGDFSWKDFRKLIREIEEGGPAFNNPFFLKTLLFLSLLFVPSGTVLLWSNPEWETMQVGRYETIPPWLVGAFTITNVTQGILGYWVTYNLLMKGKVKNALLQTLLSYLGFWFILTNGWDRSGYRRFFSSSRKDFENWSPSNVYSWLRGDVVRILLSFGTAFIPLMLYWTSKWLEEGALEAEQAGEASNAELPEAAVNRAKWPRMLKTSAVLFSSVALFPLLIAVASTVLMRKMGWLAGSLASAGLVYALILMKNSPAESIAKKVLSLEKLELDPIG